MADIKDFSENIISKEMYENAIRRQDELLSKRLESIRKIYEESMSGLDKSSEKYKKLLSDMYEKEIFYKKDADNKKNEIEQYYLSKISRDRKDSYARDKADELNTLKESLEEELKLYKDLDDNLTDLQKKRKETLEEELNSLDERVKNINSQIDKSSKRAKKEEKARAREKNKSFLNDELKSFRESFDSSNTFGDKLGSMFSFIKSGGFMAELRENLSSIADQMSDEAMKVISHMVHTGLNKVEAAIEDVTSHRTHIMARLQGLGGYYNEYNYNGLIGKVQNELALSPYLQQKEYMKKLDEAVDKGIAYNVEQRAFLAAISEDIATTFDVFDSNLLRIIRLQQADSTQARLGMEAVLTRSLNSIFSDTSYLTDSVSDAVTAALIDSEALMSRDASTEFEFIVQKWMGALYSLGASNKMVEQIAQGLNYIGTGNVQALASNSPLQTLFAMSASRGNLDYADLLTGGLNAVKTNELLKSMVEYLKEIAEDNKNNNVVKSAYGDLYQMSLSDMRAITSLSTEDINSLYNQTFSYSDMTGELGTQLYLNLKNRLSVSEMLKNVTENFIYNIGSNIVQDTFEYVMWEVTDLIENATGGIHLPNISVFGNEFNLSAFTIEDMLKTGIVGLSTLGQIGSIVSSVFNDQGLDLRSWGYEDMLSRGEVYERGGQASYSTGSITSTSGSTYIASGSGEDIKNAAIAQTMADNQSVKDITTAGIETEYSFDDWYTAVLINHDPIYTKSADEKTVADLYKAFYIEKNPVTVALDTSSALGQALYTLATTLNSANKVTDVNIKKSEITIPTEVSQLDNKLKEEIKNYIKSTYIDLLSEELRESLLGTSKNNGATIADVCEAIINDKVNVEVRNSGFDDMINNYLRFGV